MSTIDFQAELTAAGANVRNRWGAVRFFIRRYPLGAAGAVIMAILLFTASFAPYLTVYDPLSTNAAANFSLRIAAPRLKQFGTRHGLARREAGLSRPASPHVGDRDALQLAVAEQSRSSHGRW